MQALNIDPYNASPPAYGLSSPRLRCCFHQRHNALLTNYLMLLNALLTNTSLLLLTSISRFHVFVSMFSSPIYICQCQHHRHQPPLRHRSKALLSGSFMPALIRTSTFCLRASAPEVLLLNQCPYAMPRHC